MAKLRMTYKNLKALRKSKEYQAVLVDLVNVGVVPKATAEGLLGYNIPANLITDDESAGTDDPIEEGGGSGGSGSGTEGSGTSGSGTEGSGTSGSGTEAESAKVTLVYLHSNTWHTAEYDLADDPTGAGIIAFAKTEFSNNTLNTTTVVELYDAYIEAEDAPSAKYVALNPQPETLEAGMIIKVSYVESEGQ